MIGFSSQEQVALAGDRVIQNVIHITLLSAIYTRISLSSTQDDYEVSWNRVELNVTRGLRGTLRCKEFEWEGEGV